MCGWCEFLHVSGYIAANYYVITTQTNNFIAAVLVELRGSKQLIPIVGVAISGGVLIIVIILVLIIIIVIAIKYKTRNGIKHEALGE